MDTGNELLKEESHLFHSPADGDFLYWAANESIVYLTEGASSSPPSLVMVNLASGARLVLASFPLGRRVCCPSLDHVGRRVLLLEEEEKEAWKILSVDLDGLDSGTYPARNAGRIEGVRR